MKISLVVCGEVKQLMLTPETDEEKAILTMFPHDADISVEVKHGTFVGNNLSKAGYRVGECKGGFLRAYEDDESVMLVIRPRDETRGPE